ncbi:DUF3219 family protein [Aneurinibacillus sp. Ricciae_BoGa-3]|uniref:DUF3219 family protein n=1 Tax=Aneurinibacillus sp. Ricciae_BoGa-3 TaxID=3022697 RepID=UPI00234182B8|nr:DUF3219 family protein [Aneurinibacillus sp. Ricciae_BoGa-3]WCK54072.1 DUF3219 family protein [Aneurinibacillus sp. Ricciae_BoGa-3]
MVTEVILNDVHINVTGYKEDEITDEKSGHPRHKIAFDFKVRSGEEYHKITTLLYKQTFDVAVPERKLKFRGTISNYSTSFTNLYEENAVGDFKLELLEIG